MAGSIEYVGAIVFEVNGQEYEIDSFDYDIKGNRKIVKTMNRRRQASGHCTIIADISGKAEMPIPVKGEPDWLALRDGKIVIYPVEEGGTREVFRNVNVTNMGAKFKTDGEAKRNIDWSALSYGTE